MTDEVKEYVYCMSNPMYPKDIFKIGCTKNNPMLRANHLFTTGVPTPFKIEFIITTKNSKGLEKQIHNYISNYRLCDKREFFQISMDKLIEILQNELHIEIITDLLHFSNNNNNNIHIRKPINTSPKKIAKTDFNFKCDACKYKCLKKSDFNKHIKTLKHCNAVSLTSKEEETTQQKFICKNCNKSYNSRVGLWYHNKKCNICLDKQDIKSQSSYQNIDHQNIHIHYNVLHNIVLDVVKSNQEFQKHNIELQKQMIDVCKNIQTTTSK